MGSIQYYIDDPARAQSTDLTKQQTAICTDLGEKITEQINRQCVLDAEGVNHFNCCLCKVECRDDGQSRCPIRGCVCKVCAFCSDDGNRNVCQHHRRGGTTVQPSRALDISKTKQITITPNTISSQDTSMQTSCLWSLVSATLLNSALVKTQSWDEWKTFLVHSARSPA